MCRKCHHCLFKSSLLEGWQRAHLQPAAYIQYTGRPWHPGALFESWLCAQTCSTMMLWAADRALGWTSHCSLAAPVALKPANRDGHGNPFLDPNGQKHVLHVVILHPLHVVIHVKNYKNILRMRQTTFYRIKTNKNGKRNISKRLDGECCWKGEVNWTITKSKSHIQTGNNVKCNWEFHLFVCMILSYKNKFTWLDITISWQQVGRSPLGDRNDECNYRVYI